MQHMEPEILIWGNSYTNYLQMFDLDNNALSMSILDYGAGPASFNAEMTALGHQVISCDEIYALPKDILTLRIEDELKKLFADMSKHPERYCVTDATSLKAGREMAIKRFLQDFPKGFEQNRYQVETLPKLSFGDYQFDLALCSHHLFQHHGQSLEEALAAIMELCRVAHETRVFPLLTDQQQTVSFLGPLIAALQASNFGVEIRQVSYEFQKHGNAMLRVWAQECLV